MPNGIIDKPVVDAQHVYFSCRDGHVYCLDRRNGKLRWKHQLDAPLRSHGGRAEQEVPMLANRPIARGDGPLHNYDAFDVGLNSST